MGISLKQAFIFVPQDKNWLPKVLIGGLLLFFPVFAFIFPGIYRILFNPLNYYWVTLFALLTLTCMLAVSGYFFKTVHNRIVHERGKLPSWKFLTYFIHIGLKSFIGGLLFSIPFIVLFGMLAFISPMSPGQESMPYLIAAIVLNIIYTAFYIMLALNFSLDFKIHSFLNVKKAYSLIKHNILNYIILVCYCVLVSLCMLILMILLVNGQIMALLLPYVSFYICLVFADLFAQFGVNTGKEIYKEANCYS